MFALALTTDASRRLNGANTVCGHFQPIMATPKQEYVKALLTNRVVRSSIPLASRIRSVATRAPIEMISAIAAPAKRWGRVGSVSVVFMANYWFGVTNIIEPTSCL